MPFFPMLLMGGIGALLATSNMGGSTTTTTTPAPAPPPPIDTNSAADQAAKTDQTNQDQTQQRQAAQRASLLNVDQNSLSKPTLLGQ